MRINYVVSFYITDNVKSVERNNIYHSSDKFFAIKFHVDALNAFYNPDVVKATFVINKSDCVQIGDVESVLKQCGPTKIPIEVKYRDNWGLSYGAWEHHIRETINDDYDYYFLTEDDYCISNDRFYDVFHKKFTDDTAMVCGLYDGHPAVSYGLVPQKICKDMLSRYGEIFQTYNKRLNNPNYPYDGWQGYYHMNFLNAGYSIKDITDISPVVYRRHRYLVTFCRSKFELQNPGHVSITPLL